MKKTYIELPNVTEFWLSGNSRGFSIFTILLRENRTEYQLVTRIIPVGNPMNHGNY